MTHHSPSLALPLWAALALVAFAGCPSGSTSSTTGGDDDDGDGGVVAMGGSGGTGGMPSACGMDCSAIQAPQCFVSVCNEGMFPGPVGSCVIVAGEDAVPCDDGQFCTTADACLAGVCTGGPQNDCGLDPGACDELICNEASQSCTATPLPNGATCVSDDLCLVGTTCSNGLCIGTGNDCFFEPVPDDCHVSVCNPQNGMCEPQPGNEGEECTDFTDLCTVQKTCTAGVCQGGVPKNCSQLTQGCNLGVCEVATGQCIAQAVGNGQPCDDLNNCTIGELCNNSTCAGGTPITQCINADSCCAPGCDETNDDDCGNDLLILYADSPSNAADVQNKLAVFNVFPIIDLFNASTGTPTLGQLNGYDVVLVWSNNVFQNAALLGDNVADFYDLGGRVVQSTFGTCSGFNMQGRWGNVGQGYVLLTAGSPSVQSNSLGVVNEPMSALMQGVTQLAATSAYYCPGTVLNGGVVVAQWSNGQPLVIRGMVGGRSRADVNMFPPSSSVTQGYWTGHGAELLRNALLFK